MAPKLKQSSSRQEAVSEAVPWPDLPEQLIMLVGKQQLLKNISRGGLSKSWRAVPRQCNSAAKAPWLEVSEANDNIAAKFKSCQDKPRPNVLAIKEYPGYCPWYGRRHWQRPESWMRFAGCSHGFLVLSSNDDIWGVRCFQPHRTSLGLPDWYDDVPFHLATLSSPLTYWPNISTSAIMAITGISSPAYAIYRLGVCGEEKTGWIKHDCTMLDPYDTSKASQKPMAFTNAIGSKGKFYALSSQGALAVIEAVDSRFKITHIGKNRAVPSLPCKHFTEYLMDSDGEILLVLLLSRKSINTIDDVQVYQLDLHRLLWTQMESLGEDRALFLRSNCCMPVAASRVGCKSNRVYFTHPALDCWKEYDMANGSISSTYDSKGLQTKSPKWDQN